MDVRPVPGAGRIHPAHEGYSGHREACYVIGNESEKLTEVRLRVDAGLDESVSIPAPPSLTIWRFAGKDMGWHLKDWYFDARGEERSWRLKTIM